VSGGEEPESSTAAEAAGDGDRAAGVGFANPSTGTPRAPAAAPNPPGVANSSTGGTPAATPRPLPPAESVRERPAEERPGAEGGEDGEEGGMGAGNEEPVSSTAAETAGDGDRAAEVGFANPSTGTPRVPAAAPDPPEVANSSTGGTPAATSGPSPPAGSVRGRPQRRELHTEGGAPWARARALQNWPMWPVPPHL